MTTTVLQSPLQPRRGSCDQSDCRASLPAESESWTSLSSWQNDANCVCQFGSLSGRQPWCQCHPATLQSQSVLTGYFRLHIKVLTVITFNLTFSSPTFWSRLRDSTKPTLTTMSLSSPPQMMQWTLTLEQRMKTFCSITWVGTGMPVIELGN